MGRRADSLHCSGYWTVENFFFFLKILLGILLPYVSYKKLSYSYLFNFAGSNPDPSNHGPIFRRRVLDFTHQHYPDNWNLPRETGISISYTVYYFRVHCSTRVTVSLCLKEIYPLTFKNHLSFNCMSDVAISLLKILTPDSVGISLFIWVVTA